MSEMELKGCPFCGGRAATHTYETESLFSHDIVPFLRISCDNCDAANINGEQFDDVIAAWNTRAEPTEVEQLRAEVERLRKTPWVTEGGFRDVEDLLDMGRVGQSLIEAIADLCRSPGPFQHWMPADGPAEIVFDLLNAHDDAVSRATAAEAQVERLRAALERVRDYDDPTGDDAWHDRQRRTIAAQALAALSGGTGE